MENPRETDKPVVISISIPTNAYFMSGIRDFTFSLIKNMTQFSEQWAYRFQAVVDELCNNAIEHGSAKEDHIMITFTAEPKKSIGICIEDSGRGPQKSDAAGLRKLLQERLDPQYKFTDMRGRGLAKIVAAWTDALTFEDRPEGGLKVCIKKNIQIQEQTSGAGQMGRTDPTHVVLTT